MKFQNTIYGFYQACIERVENRRKELELPQIAVYHKDKSLVSNFFNCKCTKNNPYLITKEFINSKDESGNPAGCIPILKFKNEWEILWGTDSELRQSLPLIYMKIITDLLACKTEYGIDMKSILCDYVPYAKYSTLHQIKHQKNILLLPNYGVYDEAVNPLNMLIYQQRAICYLYSKDYFRNSFENAFYRFAKETPTFTKIDKILDENFIKPILIPLLKKELPSGTSLGLRAKNLIENDISKASELLSQANSHGSKSSSELTKMLVNSSSKYVTELEKVQQKEILEKHFLCS